MAENFHGSKKKIQRAAKHIIDLNSWVAEANFYLLSVHKDAERQIWVTLFFDPETTPAEDAQASIRALIGLRSLIREDRPP